MVLWCTGIAHMVKVLLCLVGSLDVQVIVLCGESDPGVQKSMPEGQFHDCGLTEVRWGKGGRV